MFNRNYMYASRFDNYRVMPIESNSVYVYQRGVEPRSLGVSQVQHTTGRNVCFLEIAEDTTSCDEPYSNNAQSIVEVGTNKIYSLKSELDLDALLVRNAAIENIYLDASGLSIRVLAALLRRSIQLKDLSRITGRVFVVYAEPISYNVRRFSEEGEYFDLSEKVTGFKPLPGFARILPLKQLYVFVPCLGFEGGRLAHALSTYRDNAGEVVPIVGVPGYRPEYPFVSYSGNRRPLSDFDVYSQIRYAEAGSVVDAFVLLLQILREAKREAKDVVVAPIGTKPHTIAALLLFCCDSKSVEIAYDNPIRKKPRTKGIGGITITCVSDMKRDLYVS